MEAITLYQPWAWLVEMGLKQYETRSWVPHQYWRGRLAIHASKRWTREEQGYLERFIQEFPDVCRGLPKLLPLGAVLCIAELEAVYQVEAMRDYISPQERAFGNYADGRFAWKLRVVEVFDAPIPARGNQGLWQWVKP